METTSKTVLPKKAEEKKDFRCFPTYRVGTENIGMKLPIRFPNSCFSLF